MRRATIYRLTLDGETRYIGSTTVPLNERLYGHRGGNTNNPELAALFANGRLEIEPIIYVPEEQAREMEQVAIDAAREAGMPLVNRYAARAKCGSRSGYVAHHKRGERPCEPCHATHVAYCRGR